VNPCLASRVRTFTRPVGCLASGGLAFLPDDDDLDEDEDQDEEEDDEDEDDEIAWGDEETDEPEWQVKPNLGLRRTH